ncbi:copper-translocating P-type ATPase [Chelativorans intermedius]|uniref:Copper-translocating P-type ATPase n=1 Tax=Chelativorans intermedius TaxID=515947 RepID=A0ABV6D820_9HYPH|nr:copper-translocating P-type ATPase [Chelativorans intermedius]MCT8999912.1 copper-translocating P-type ATPase [Chelativorans intermedius]
MKGQEHHASGKHDHAATTQDHTGHAEGGHDHGAMIADFKRRFWVSLVLTVPILLLSPMIQDFLGLGEALRFAGSRFVLFALSSVVFFYGGWPFLKGFVGEIRKRQTGMMTLISMAISVAYLYSTATVFGLAGEPFFWELATLIDVMLLGHWIEMRSVMGASAALEALVKLMPATADRLRPDGSTEEVQVTELVAGDRVLVRPGAKVPTDGVIVEGRTSLDESMLTGESKPVERNEGDEVIGGAVNGEGAITIEIRKTGSETYLAQVIEMVRRAQESRSRSQNLADTGANILTYTAIVIGTVTLVVWLSLGAPIEFAIARAVTVLVIACPHALGLAVPLVVAVSTRLSATSGLLIRERASFERARNLDAVIFDKTGTLTEGRFGVADVIPLGDMGADEVLAWAAAIESQSEHPIARGVIRSAEEKGIRPKPVRDFRNLTGEGTEAVVDGRDVKVVSPGYLRRRDIGVESTDVERANEQGKTVVYVLVDDALVGAIALADIVRKESREAVRKLKEMGIECMMLTGDARAVAKSVAAELGLDDYFAEVLPDQKAEKVREVQSRGKSVAMVGDGVNDAPALVQADCGIAIGAGTDVAVQSADIVLVRNDPRDVTAILALSRATYRKMIENFVLGAGYNVVAIPLAAGVAYAWGIVLTPAVGAALMSASTVVVAINAKLLERRRKDIAALGLAES